MNDQHGIWWDIFEVVSKWVGPDRRGWVRMADE